MQGTSYFWDLIEPMGLDDTEAIDILEEFGFSRNDIMLLFFHPTVYTDLRCKASREYRIIRPKWCEISTFGELSRSILFVTPPVGPAHIDGRSIHLYRGLPEKIIEFCAKVYKSRR